MDVEIKTIAFQRFRRSEQIFNMMMDQDVIDGNMNIEIHCPSSHYRTCVYFGTNCSTPCIVRVAVGEVFGYESGTAGPDSLDYEFWMHSYSFEAPHYVDLNKNRVTTVHEGFLYTVVFNDQGDRRNAWLHNYLVKDMSPMQNFDWYGPVLVIKSSGGEVFNMTQGDVPYVEKLTLRCLTMKFLE